MPLAALLFSSPAFACWCPYAGSNTLSEPVCSDCSLPGGGGGAEQAATGARRSFSGSTRASRAAASQESWANYNAGRAAVAAENAANARAYQRQLAEERARDAAQARQIIGDGFTSLGITLGKMFDDAERRQKERAAAEATAEAEAAEAAAEAPEPPAPPPPPTTFGGTEVRKTEARQSPEQLEAEAERTAIGKEKDFAGDLGRQAGQIRAQRALATNAGAQLKNLACEGASLQEYFDGPANSGELPGEEGAKLGDETRMMMQGQSAPSSSCGAAIATPHPLAVPGERTAGQKAKPGKSAASAPAGGGGARGELPPAISFTATPRIRVLGAIQPEADRVEDQRRLLASVEVQSVRLVEVKRELAQTRKELPKASPQNDELDALERRVNAAARDADQAHEQTQAALHQAEGGYRTAAQAARVSMKSPEALEQFLREQDDKHADERRAAGTARPAQTPQGEPAPKENPGFTPAVRIERPSDDSVDFIVRAQKRYGDQSLPYPDVALEVSWPESSLRLQSDLGGAARLSPAYLNEHWPKGVPRLKISAALGEAAARQAITVTHDELSHYVEAGAASLAGEGDALLDQKRFAQAADKYWASQAWRPTDRAAKGLTAALEKAGAKHAALDACRHALARSVNDVSARKILKTQAVEIGSSLSSKPPTPVDAMDAIEAGAKAFKASNYQSALYQYELASTFAPWWHEPYYALGVAFEAFMVEKGLSFARPALDNFVLFEKAAPRDDPRLVEARQEEARLSKILAKINQ